LNSVRENMLSIFPELRRLLDVPDKGVGVDYEYVRIAGTLFTQNP
jgi:hypothetical protein